MDADAKKYEELTDYFIEYYSSFDVVDGIVQDPSITIGENMADFAGMTVIMGILDGDPDAQREALEDYARTWVSLGSASVKASDNYLQDVHSADSVRVDAVVASLYVFYGLYDISEDDPMYVAPENRLRLW